MEAPVRRAMMSDVSGGNSVGAPDEVLVLLVAALAGAAEHGVAAGVAEPARRLVARLVRGRLRQRGVVERERRAGARDARAALEEPDPHLAADLLLRALEVRVERL